MLAQRTLEGAARKFLTPAMSRWAKRLAVRSRYRAQAKACREGFEQYGDRYPRPVLFIAGLPKSGTTWLEKMVSSFPGYHELLIPDVAAHEMRAGGSHDYDLPEDMFGRFENMLVLTKMHVHGSEHNVRLLHEAGVPYVVLFRDLRDVAISNFYYVRNTPWHPEHPHYRGLALTEGLKVFAERTLAAYADWVRSWDANRDPQRSVVLRYEQMLDGALGAIKQVAAVFELPGSDQELAQIVDRHSFKRMSGGRDRGHSADGQFVRKGVAGDWVNHFDGPLRDLYKQKIGQFLIDYGYERDLNW